MRRRDLASTLEQVRAAEECIAQHLTARQPLPCCGPATERWDCATLRRRRLDLPHGHAWGHAAEWQRLRCGYGAPVVLQDPSRYPSRDG